MNTRSIKNDQDHEWALGRIYNLMEAKAGTPEGEELDVLVTLVHSYESEHHPIEAPDPIEAINSRMEQSRRDSFGMTLDNSA